VSKIGLVASSSNTGRIHHIVSTIKPPLPLPLLLLQLL
jgi:hypothetical protein